MKRNLLLSAVMLFIVVFMFGCKSEVDNYDRSIQELATYMMRETGATWDGPWETGPVHAESGFALRIDNRQVVFLKYNPKLKKMKRKMDYVDEKGFLYIAAYKFPAVRNGSFVMLDYKGFKSETRDKLLKAFQDF